MSTSAATAPAARLHAASTGKAHAASARWGALRHGAPRRGGRCFAFGSNSKEEAAKKALRDALMGKKDILAEVEKNNLMRESGGGGGGGPGGRKGGGGGGGGFGDWNRLRRETGETLKAVGIIVGVLVLFSTWRQLLAVLVNLVFWVLRVPTGEKAEVVTETAAEHVVSAWANTEDDDAPAQR